MTSVVLKPRHSLIGRSLLPIILDMQSGVEVENFARLKKDHPLERYSLEHLENEFHGITGELASKIFQILGKDKTQEDMMRLVHFTIVFANSHGAPKGQILSPEPIPLTSTAPGPSSTGNETPAVTASTVTVSIPTVSTPTVSTSIDLETRIKSMEQNVIDLTARKEVAKVEDALREVRVLASRPKLTQPHVLIASLENLVDIATKASYKDTEFFSKTLQACRRYDDDSDVCGLCMKLLGSTEDRKVATAVSEWAKGKKYENKTTPVQSSDVNMVKSESQPQGAVFSPGVPFGMQPFSPFPTYQQFGFPMANQGYFGGPAYVRHRFRRPYNNLKGACFLCKQRGHFAADCPKARKN